MTEAEGNGGEPVNSREAKENAPTHMTIVYTHDHDCPWKNEHVTLRPNISSSVALVIQPVCLVTRTELAVVQIYTDELL